MQTVGIIPCSILLWCQLQTAYNDNRIRIRLINRFRFISIPLDDCLECIGCFIKCCGIRIQMEVIRYNLKAGIIQIHFRINLYIDIHFRQLADSSGQLQQQSPRCHIACITTGNQTDEIFQLLRYRDFPHVHGKDIGDIHRFIRINGMIDIRRIAIIALFCLI